MNFETKRYKFQTLMSCQNLDKNPNATLQTNDKISNQLTIKIDWIF